MRAREFFPLRRTRQEYTALLFSRYHFTRFTPKTLTAKGDQVWGVFEAEALHRPSGKYVQSDISMRWTVKDGKITEHQGFFDTAGVLMQQGDLTVEAARRAASVTTRYRPAVPRGMPNKR